MSDLLSKTLRLAKASTLPPRDICSAANVGYRWYCRLLNGDFDDPGVNKIERLYAVLSQKAPHKSPRGRTSP